VTTESPLDVAAALTEDGRWLTIGVVNPTMQALDLPLQLAAVSLAGQGQGKRWQIAGPDPMAYNDPGQPPRVAIRGDTVGIPLEQIKVEPCSVTLFALPLAVD
jgi:alpha-N-arabinofuranosidase